MAASEVSICNLALGKVGSQLIMSLDDASPEARSCKLHYADTRDEVLRHHRWNFAITRETLTQLAQAPQFGWTFQYQLPQDCLRVLQLNSWAETEPNDKWEIEGRKLMTNEETAQIKYIRREEDANLFDSIFVEAFSIKLASKIARQLTGNAQNAASYLEEYIKFIAPLARRTDAFEGDPPRKPPWAQSALVASRFASTIG